MEAFFTCLILLIIILIRTTFSSSLFNPCTILCLSWMSILFMMPILAPEYYFTIKTSFFIVLFCVCFLAGEFLSYIYAKNAVILNVSYTDTLKVNLYRYCTILSLLSFLGAILYLKSFISYFGSFGEFFVAGALVREALFDGDIQIPRMVIYMSLLGYTAVILSLTYFVKYGFSWFQVLSILSIVLFAISQAGRAGIIIVLLQVFAAKIFRGIVLDKKNQVINFLKPVIAIVLAVTVLFLLIESFRSQDFELSDSNSKKQFSSLNVYIFGGTAGFTSYLRDLYPLSWDFTYGKYSFSALFQLLGIAKQETGVYDQYLHVSDFDTGNVYSILRPLLDDFGILGLVLWGLGIGAFSNFCFESIQRHNPIYVSLCIAFYSYLIFSPIAPLTQFNSYLFSLFLCPLFIYVSKFKITFKYDNTFHLR